MCRFDYVLLSATETQLEAQIPLPRVAAIAILFSQMR